MMRKRFGLVTAGALFLGMMLIVMYPIAAKADVDVNVGIHIPLPVYVIPSPPAVLPIPKTYLYYAPDVEIEILFYHGFWYRPHKGGWYKAESYNGPWVFIVPGSVPHVLLKLPPDYRKAKPVYEKIPYGQLKKHWKTWEKERRWEKEKKKKHISGGKGQKKGRD